MIRIILWGKAIILASNQGQCCHIGLTILQYIYIYIYMGHSRRSQHRFTGRLLRLYSKFIGWFVTKKERLSPSFSPQLGSPRPGGQKPFFSPIWIFNDFFCNFALKTLNLTEKKFWKHMIDGKFSVEHDAAISFLI